MTTSRKELDKRARLINISFKRKYEEMKDSDGMYYFLLRIAAETGVPIGAFQKDKLRNPDTVEFLDMLWGCIRVNEPAPCNELLATVWEWISIVMEKVPTIHDKNSVYKAANVARLFRGADKVARNPDLYNPLLAEYCASVKDFRSAIQLLMATTGDYEDKCRFLTEKMEEAEPKVDSPFEEGLTEQTSTKRKKKKKEKGTSSKEEVNATISIESTTVLEVETQQPTVSESVEKFGLIRLLPDIPVSFIPPTNTQMNAINNLYRSSKQHLNYLSVNQPVLDASNKAYLVTEEVYTIEEFCEEIYSKLQSECSEIITDQVWWEYIKPKFDKIFGGIGQGLIHRFRANLTCGEIGFNTYVTKESFEGRILLSMEPSLDDNDDVLSWIQTMKTMKTVIKFAHVKRSLENLEDKFSVNLPMELVHLLEYVGNTKRGNIPSAFWVDHPYFWTQEERIMYVRRLNRAIRTGRSRKNFAMVFNECSSVASEWWMKLGGRYERIWRKGESNEIENENQKGGESSMGPSNEGDGNMIRVYQYVGPASILRYINAVYTHINDLEYCDQNEYIISDLEVEQYFRGLFPSLVTDTWEALCIAEKWNVRLGIVDLTRITNFRFFDNSASTEAVVSKEEWLG